jgi:Putative adhesin
MIAPLKLRRALPLLAVLLLTGTAARAVELKERFDRTVPLRSGSKVELSNVNGGATFVAWDRDEVRVEAEKKVKAGNADEAQRVMKQIRIEVTQTAGGGLRIETKTPRRENGFFDWLYGRQVSFGVTYRVHVPRRTPLVAENVNGGLTVTGTRGQAKLVTTNGGITVNGVQGNLDLVTVNGGVNVSKAAGELRATTTNGSIEAELASLPEGSDLKFETVNGRVSIRLPSDARLTIDAAAANGRVQSELPVEGGQPGRRSLKGDINGGGGTLYIRTVNGGIDIDEL